MRLYIKPPPSDQIWFGFTCMPDIDFNLESSVGDHKITNGRLALLLISRLKVRFDEMHYCTHPLVILFIKLCMLRTRKELKYWVL